jgi:predicted O-methyltransferase YrrM
MDERAVEQAVGRMSGIPGWFSPAEARVLYRTACAAFEKFPQSSIVEIGSFHGRSTVVLGSAAQRNPRRLVYAIDPHEGDLSSGKVDPTWEAFQKNIADSDVFDCIVPVRSRAGDIIWEQGPISLLFIDGLHDYKNVRNDYTRFRRHVPAGAFVAFHDYANPDHPDVQKYVDSLAACGEVEKVSVPESPDSLIVTRRRASFSIIIPTCGRERLLKTLESIVGAGVNQGDEVIVVGDGPQPTASAIVKDFYPRCPAPIRYLETEVSRAMGALQRNMGMRLAQNSHLIFIDDDDEYVPDAFFKMRIAAEENPGKIIFFRIMEKRPKIKWDTIWQTRRVAHGNVGTQTLVLPNVRDRFGTWPNRRGSDYEFIRQTVDLWPGKDNGVVWMEPIVAYLY